MSDNQYNYEIIRDIGYSILAMKEHETIWFNITRDANTFFTARGSVSIPCGKSETARAIALAFKVTRGYPDSRDIKIEQLNKHNVELKNNNKNLIEKNAFLRQRPDLPVDRIPAYTALKQELGLLEISYEHEKRLRLSCEAALTERDRHSGTKS